MLLVSMSPEFQIYHANRYVNINSSYNQQTLASYLFGLSDTPVSSIFLSEQSSHQQLASSTFLSEQINIIHQPNE
jgi:hypothetical protein